MASLPSKDEILRQLKEGAPQMEAVLSNLAGKRVRFKPDEQMAGFLSNMLPFLQEFQNLASTAQAISEEEKKKKLDYMLNGILRTVAGNITDSPLDAFIKLLSSTFDDPDDISILKKTNFSVYRKALLDIADQVFSKGKRDDIKALFTGIPETDAYATYQTLGRLEKKMPFLQKSHKRITKQVVEKHIEIYDELAGYMEKLAMQMFGIKEVLKGNTITYTDLKKRKLADCVNSLLTVPEFATLMRPLNVTIRNAIAHKQVIFEPLTRTVKFTDKHKAVSLKYEEFVLQTRELYAATFYTSHIETALNLRLWQYIRNYVRNAEDTKSDSSQ